jgi:hypothetical protein
MPRLPIPSDAEAFTEETRAAVRHILQTRTAIPGVLLDGINRRHSIFSFCAM